MPSLYQWSRGSSTHETAFSADQQSFRNLVGFKRIKQAGSGAKLNAAPVLLARTFQHPFLDDVNSRVCRAKVLMRSRVSLAAALSQSLLTHELPSQLPNSCSSVADPRWQLSTCGKGFSRWLVILRGIVSSSSHVLVLVTMKRFAMSDQESKLCNRKLLHSLPATLV